MKLEGPSAAGSKVAFILGWVLSALPILMMVVMPIGMVIWQHDAVVKGATGLGYPQYAANIIVTLEIACGLIYAIPQTAALGAILLTGYLGGAVASHVRAEDPHWFIPAIAGVIVWLGLFLRDKRLRVLLPFRM